MGVFRLILIIIVVIIFSIVLYNLLKERSILLKQINHEEQSKLLEGLTVSESIADIFSNALKITIENMNPKRKPMALKEYCIKASYNSAYDGSKISLDTLKYVLSRGCRFIDLQIHYSIKDSIPFVANITDPAGVDMESENHVSLYNIFTSIISNAFAPTYSNGGCPNSNDPLFIHMRVIPDKDNLVYNSIARCIESVFPKEMRVLNNNGNALLLENNTTINGRFKRRALFLMDKTNNPQYSYNSQALVNLINGETGGSTFQTYDYGKIKNSIRSPPVIMDDFQTTNITTEKIVMPEILERYPPPSIIDMVVNYGVQITLFPFYTKNDELHIYEKLFNEHRSAIIPMAYAISYLDNTEKSLASKKIKLGPL
jgi:hypothetical protein